MNMKYISSRLCPQNFLSDSFFSSSSKTCSHGKKITLCAAHSYTSSVCAPVYVCVCLWALVQGYNVGLGMCRLTGTFTLSTVSACAANFSIWITEIHTNTNRMMALEKNDHMAEVGAEQPERSQVC